MPQQFESQDEQSTDVTQIVPSEPLPTSTTTERATVGSSLNAVASQQDWEATVQRWHRANKRTWWRFIGVDLVPSLFWPLLIVFCSSVAAWNVPLIALLGISMLVTGSLLYMRGGERTEIEANITPLDYIDDVHAIGPLLQIFQNAAFGHEQSLAAGALIRLLPRLREADPELLTSRYRALLYGRVTMPTATHYPQLFTACMSAIEQVGDTGALPHLARLIARDAPTQNEQQARERTRACLNCLLERLDFGTVQSIPDWIALLPYTAFPNSGAPYRRGGPDTALIATFALIRLLPQLQPSDAPLFKPGLGDHLSQGWLWMSGTLMGTTIPQDVQIARLGSDYSFAVLEALKQVGTGQDYPIPNGIFLDVPSDDLPRLRVKAREVNSILETRRDKEQVGSMLLRGASAPTATPGELLRPATAGQNQSEPQELLRADTQQKPG